MKFKRNSFLICLVLACTAMIMFAACGGSSGDDGITFRGQVTTTAVPAFRNDGDTAVPLPGVTVGAGGGMDITDADGNYEFNGFGSDFQGGDVLLTVTDPDGNPTDFTLEDVPANAREFVSSFLVQADGTVEQTSSEVIVDDDTVDDTMEETNNSVCGDEVVDDGEECDDGNTDNGDGCDENCIIEGAVNDPVPVCGDEVVDDGEECDDGNTDNGDGCDENCIIEGADDTNGDSGDGGGLTQQFMYPGTYPTGDGNCGFTGNIDVQNVNGDSQGVSVAFSGNDAITGSAGNDSFQVTGVIVLNVPDHTCNGVNTDGTNLLVACTNPQGGSCSQQAGPLQ